MRTRLTLGAAGLGDGVGFMIGLAPLGGSGWGVAWQAREKSGSASEVELACPQAHEASVRIGHHLDGLARRRASASGVAGTRTKRVPSETARWPDLAGPCWTRPVKPSGTLAKNVIPVSRANVLASRPTRELPPIGQLLGQDQSSGAVAHHLDALARPGARLGRVRDEDKAPPVGHRQVGGAFGPSLEPAPKACRGALEKLLAALPGHLPSHRHSFEVGDFGGSLGIVRAMPSSCSTWRRRSSAARTSAPNPFVAKRAMSSVSSQTGPRWPTCASSPSGSASIDTR